jgi:hypothetical protein
VTRKESDMTKTADVRQLEKDAMKRAKRRERLEVKRAKLDEEEKVDTVKVEAILLAQIREAGLMRLPLTRLLETINGFANVAETPSVTKDNSKSGERQAPNNATSGGSAEGSDEDRELAAVTVKISSNTSAENRTVLENAKLHWNGKTGTWRGNVDDRDLAILRQTFGDRMTVKPRSRPEEGRLEADPNPTPVQPSLGPADTPPEPSAPTTERVGGVPVDDKPTGYPATSLPTSDLLPRGPFGTLPRRAANKAADDKN